MGEVIGRMRLGRGGEVVVLELHLTGVVVHSPPSHRTNDQEM